MVPLAPPWRRCRRVSWEMDDGKSSLKPRAGSREGLSFSFLSSQENEVSRFLAAAQKTKNHFPFFFISRRRLSTKQTKGMAAASSGYVSSSFCFVSFVFHLLVVLMLGFTCIVFHLFVVLVLVLFSLFILVQVLVLFYWQPFLESPPRPSFEPWRVCGATALPTAKRPNQLCASLINHT